MAHATPQVEGDTLFDPAHAAQAIKVGTPPWYAWLGGAALVPLVVRPGPFTARKERRGLVEGFWRAYRRRAGLWRSAYIGKPADLTLARLQQVAATLAPPTSAAGPPVQ